MRRPGLSLALVLGLAACGTGMPPIEPVDSGGPPADTGTPPVDTGTPPEDTGTPPMDTGTPPADTTPPEDTNTPPVDTAPMCMPTEAVCGGGCVDTQTSTLHCGRCDNPCASGELCRAGACAPSVLCTGGMMLCGGGCVDTATDGAHCGMCGRACAMTERCMGGMCRAVTTCPMGQTDCGGMCVDTQASAMHCGSCGNACAGMETCAMGICQPPMCTGGQTRCTSMGVSSCVNTMTDSANCGACGTACTMDQVCMGGTCRASCVAPRATCTVGGMSVCLDVQTDNANCGRCGNACTAGQGCVAGRCQCSATTTMCGATCVNTMTDSANCGRCGNACGAEQTCSGGMCRCGTGLTLCGTACVDTSRDLANCGRCGTRCTAPATCNTGMCNSVCGTGTTSCGGMCVATSTFLTDGNNCGRCGNRCGTGTSCVLGTCRPTNNNRLSAIAIVPNPGREVTVTGNSTGATYDGPTVPCGCTSGNGNVWYRFQTPSEGVVYLDTAGSSYDTSLFLTNAAGVAVPGQAASGFPDAGLCNDDTFCGTGGGFTSGLQSRTAGVLAAGTYYVAVGGCDTGAFTLHLQFVARSVARDFEVARMAGTGNTGSRTLGTLSVTAGTCGGTGGAEFAQWFLSCGATATRQLFSTCRSDPGAMWTRRTSLFSTTTFDPVLYVRSAQNGMQVDCNDDGSGAGVDCRGEIPRPIIGPALDTNQYGSRLSGLSTPRGVGVTFVDTRGVSTGMRYNMRFEAP